MLRSALAVLALLSLLGAFPTAPLTSQQEGTDGGKVIVAEETLQVYPRFNKSLKPITTVDSGQKLLILRKFKAWIQVQIEGSDQKGWIQAKVKKSHSMMGKSYDIVASPSTTGLVARGWSKSYAAKNGADFSKVEKIKKRTLDPERYEKFLRGGRDK